MKLLQLFSCLQKEEVKQLRKAVHSPLLNTNPKVIQLFDLLRPYHPDLDPILADRSKIFRKVFPKASFSEQKLRKLFSELTRVIENFLVFSEMEKEEFQRQKQLVSIYNQRGMHTLFFKGNKALLKQLEDYPKQSAKQYAENLEVLSMKYFHPLHDKQKLEDKALMELRQNLDKHFIISNLRLALILKSREQVLNESHPLPFLETIIIVGKTYYQKENLLIELYLLAANFSMPNATVDFLTFEQLLFAEFSNLEPIDQTILFFAGLNYLIKKSNSNESVFLQKTYEWYLFGDEQALLIQQNIITQSHFANAVIAACKQKEFAWAYQFIAHYLPFLETANPEMEASYYYGLLNFLQADWDKALDYLMYNGMKDYYPPRTRAILCRVLFEKYLLDDSYFELLVAQLNAFEAYVRRDVYFSKKKLDSHLNFIQITRMLTKKIHAKERRNAIQQWFNQKTHTAEPILAKHWIIQKVQYL